MAADLDGRVRETAAAAQARAQTLAQLPRLAWAVATDEQTMLDLTADELAFRPAPGELIEIGQVVRRTGAIISLLRLGGVAGVRLPLDDVGQHLVGHDGLLHVVSVVSVEAKQHADQLRGAVAVSRVVEVAPLQRQLELVEPRPQKRGAEPHAKGAGRYEDYLRRAGCTRRNDRCRRRRGRSGR